MACGPRKTLMMVSCATFVTLLYLKKNHGKVANIPLFGKFAEVDEKGPVDTKDCHFDKDCHSKVDWNIIGSVKEGFFERAKLLEEQRNTAGVKRLMGHTHGIFAKAGMPEDRIDYTLTKWMKSVYPAALEADEKGPVDEKDCYFDKDCHSKVDWEKIGSVKQGFFMRAKLLEKQSNTAGVKELMGRMHGIFAKAGMPEDRIDYILAKWVKFVYPAALEAEPEAEKAGEATEKLKVVV